jgi:hypothetical protein
MQRRGRRQATPGDAGVGLGLFSKSLEPTHTAQVFSDGLLGTPVYVQNTQRGGDSGERVISGDRHELTSLSHRSIIPLSFKLFCGLCRSGPRN